MDLLLVILVGGPFVFYNLYYNLSVEVRLVHRNYDFNESCIHKSISCVKNSIEL